MTCLHHSASACCVDEEPRLVAMVRIFIKETPMAKYALAVVALYPTAVATAWALPSSPLPQLTSSNDIVQVRSKSKGKSHKGHSHSSHHHHPHYSHNHKYHYHGHYYGHRYSYRPRGAFGCIQAGPVWYCP